MSGHDRRWSQYLISGGRLATGVKMAVTDGCGVTTVVRMTVTQLVRNGACADQGDLEIALRGVAQGLGIGVFTFAGGGG